MLFLKQNMCFPHALITISRLHSSVQYKKYYATLSTTPMVLNEMQYDEIQSRLCVFCVLFFPCISLFRNSWAKCSISSASSPQPDPAVS